MGGSGSGPFLKLQSRHWLRLLSSEGLTRAGGPLSKIAQFLTRPQFLSCCWQEASVLCQMNSFHKSAGIYLPHGSWLFQKQVIQDSKEEATLSSMT